MERFRPGVSEIKGRIAQGWNTVVPMNASWKEAAARGAVDGSMLGGGGRALKEVLDGNPEGFMLAFILYPLAVIARFVVRQSLNNKRR